MIARLGSVDWRSDDGQVAGVEAIPFGILLFVIGALLVANAWAVVDAKMAATSAAREAARTFVEADDPATALADAEDAAREAVAAYGRNPDHLAVTGGDGAGALARCAEVTFTVGVPVPAVQLPVIGGLGAITVRASHTEVVDPFRDRNDGTGGEARCG